MAAELLPHFQGVQIEKLDCTVSTGREHEVTLVMEAHSPNWLCVDVGEGVSDPCTHEVPQFHGPITASCDQVGTQRMEVNSADPVSVALPRHYILTVVQVPDLPRAVIAGCCHDVFAHVQGETANASLMSINFPNSLETRINIIVGSCEPGIRSGILIGEGCRLSLGRRGDASLLLLALFELFGSAFLVILDLHCHFVDFLLNLFLL